MKDQLKSKILASLGLAVALAIPVLAQADTATDATGDWWTSTTKGAYDGSRNGDLDVIGVSATYNTGTQTFSIVATMNGAVGTTASAAYVWGVNTGSGAATFGSQGLNGVLFNKTILITAGAAGAATSNLAGSTASYSGSVLTLLVPLSALPAATNGFAATDYTWNLWPRDTTANLVQPISDFAPDNSNIHVTAVPEPASVMLMGAGVAALLLLRRRKA